MKLTIKTRRKKEKSDLIKLFDIGFLKKSNNLDSLIKDYSSTYALEYLKLNCDVISFQTKVLITDNLFSIKNHDLTLDTFVNLHRVNDIRFINKFFEGINEELPFEGKFICCVETFQARKERKFISKIPFLSHFYFFMEFLFMRVFPKVKFLKHFYFVITRGKNRLLSKSETLGRLICCGFEISNYKEIDGLLYITAIKKKEPKYDMNPSYGPIYKMPRVGKDKKIIYVYKLRTMHPYSEYLQEYMFENFGTANGDKVNDDFRISKIGKIFRKFWVDELPMLVNLVKGDIKIVGVRPLSSAKFYIYPEFAQVLRVKAKPGLIPPFYVDLPVSFEGLVDSEVRYTESYLKNPIRTDVKYLFKALYNIFIKGARSK